MNFTFQCARLVQSENEFSFFNTFYANPNPVDRVRKPPPTVDGEVQLPRHHAGTLQNMFKNCKTKDKALYIFMIFRHEVLQLQSIRPSHQILHRA